MVPRIFDISKTTIFPDIVNLLKTIYLKTLFIPDHFLGNLMTSLKKIIRTLVISSTFYPSEGESF